MPLDSRGLWTGSFKQRNGSRFCDSGSVPRRFQKRPPPAAQLERGSLFPRKGGSASGDRTRRRTARPDALAAQREGGAGTAPSPVPLSRACWSGRFRKVSAAYGDGRRKVTIVVFCGFLLKGAGEGKVSEQRA